MSQKLTQPRIRKFLSYYRPYRKIFIIDMMFAAFSAVAVLLFPLVSGYITREVLTEWSSETQRKLMLAGLLLLLILVLKVVSNVIYAYYGHTMGARMEGLMRDEMFCHYEELSFSYHAHTSVGSMMTIISHDLTSMTELFHHGPEDLMMTLIKFVGAFVILLHINVPLTLIVFLVLPLLSVVAVRTDRVMSAGLIRSKRNLSRLNEHLEDTLSGIRTVKAFGNEDYEARRFAECNIDYTESKCYFYKVEACFYEVVQAYPEFLTMLVIFFGALFIGRGQLDIPVLITFLLYVGTLAQPVMIMLNFMRLYEDGKASFIRFMEMLEIQPSIVESSHPVDLGASSGDIVLDDVSFQYEDGTESVLEHVSLQIDNGRSIAFVGASGIGKSTISMLISRFYDVTEGRITIGGLDVRELSMASLRKAIGIVQQEVFIFNGTIRDNILYGKEDATEEEVRAAAALANADEFIEKLDQGYDSVVGTHGITLSGGQRQRLSLARVFLKNPSILILDEATSALDYESELLIQTALNRLMRDRTCIVIAHRLSTIKHVDQIFVLADKTISEMGTHDQLLEKNGDYAKLYYMGNTAT